MSVDGYMNISLEKTEEYVDGKLRRSYGEAFVRGNNGSFLFHNIQLDSLLTYLQCCISPPHEFTVYSVSDSSIKRAKHYRPLA